MSTPDRAPASPSSGEEHGEPNIATTPAGPSPTESTTVETCEEADALSKDVIFDILKNQRRRHVLRFLRDDPATTLSDLAEHVGAVENGTAVERLTSNERKRVYVGLYQCHLPRMRDAGVIRYDRARGSVELRDRAAQLFPYVDIDPSEDPGDGGSGLGRIRDVLAALMRSLGR